MTVAALSGEVVGRMLRAAAAAIAAEARALPDEILSGHPAPGEWCVKDVIGHLIEAERRGFAGRIRIILGADAPQLEGWEPADVARDRRDCVKPIATLLDEFLAVREESTTLATGLDGRALTRIGRHPKVGDLTVNDLLHEWVHHDRNHLKQILTNVQLAAWAHMGNARRFSAPSPTAT
jgi:hypothetical protein